MSAPDLELAEAAWRWVLDQVRYDDGGPWIPLTPAATEPEWDRDGMHSGIGGLVHALSAVAATRSWTDEEAALAAAIADRLRAVTPSATDVTYFDGLVSHLQCLVLLGEPGVDACVDRLLELAPDGWPDCSDATLGTAAILFGALTAVEAGSARGAELATYAAERLLAEAEETAGRPELAVRPAPARPAGQARRRSPGRDAELVARTGRDRRRARSGRGRAGETGPGRDLPTGRRAPGHAGRPRVTRRRRLRGTPADPAQARHGRVHVELVPRPGRQPWAVRRAGCGRGPRGRGRAADSVDRPLPALAAHVGHPRAPLPGLLGQRRPLLRHRRCRLGRATSRPGVRAGAGRRPRRPRVRRGRPGLLAVHRAPQPRAPASRRASAGCRARPVSPAFLFEVSR